MKENPNKEIELIRKLSQLMTKEKITKLKYKNSDLKLSIDKNVQPEKLVSTQTQKTALTETKENETSKTMSNLDVNPVSYTHLRAHET